MQVFRSLAGMLLPERASVVTIGNFDGVHRGHQSILAKVIERARALDATPALVTLDPHPLKVLRPESAPLLILPLEERVRLIEAAGIEWMLILPFTLPFSRTPAEDFVRDVLAGALRCREAYLGPNFHFGRDQEGDVDLLKRLGPRYGFSADKVPEVFYKDFMISSSLVRSTVAEGQVALARRLLGRPFTLIGEVVRGDGRGRELGFPTANLAALNELLPGDGVYVTRAVVDGRRRRSATNIGRRPTFGGQARVVETHLLSFQGDLYGRPLRLEFLKRLRGEKRFAGIEELKAQIGRDVGRARSHFRRLAQRARERRRGDTLPGRSSSGS
jgi:riboflavin kinase/FMN adenylyltransferase